MNYHFGKSSPKVFMLEQFLRDTQPTPFEGYLQVCKGAVPGDIIFLGMSGECAGVYGKALVLKSPAYERDEEGNYWINREDAEKPRWYSEVRFLHNLIERPILESRLQRVPALKRLAKWLHFQGAVCHLSDEEGLAIARLITGRP